MHIKEFYCKRPLFWLAKTVVDYQSKSSVENVYLKKNALKNKIRN